MTARKTLLLLSLLLLPLSAPAEEEFQTYVIQKGDTLWGISEKFLKDPYYWPSLWSNNPSLTNPHFIYPGQKIAIYDGRIEILPAEMETVPVAEVVEPVVPAPELPPPPAEEKKEITIKTLGGARGFVATEEMEAAGVLVDTVDNRILMGSGDTVFVSMKNLKGIRPGTRFDLIESGDEVSDPVTGERLGYKVIRLGKVEIREVNRDVATARILEAHQEIQRGSRLIPVTPPVKKVALKKPTRSLSGQIISTSGNRIILGQYDIIYLDLGRNDGLEPGNMMYISRPRKASEFGIQGEEVTLPDILLGAAVVLETEAKTSSALVLKVADPLFRGDRVTTAME